MNNRIWYAIIILATTFIGGYYTGHSQSRIVEVKTQSVVTAAEQQEVKVVYRDRVVTKTIVRKADGASTTVVRTEERSKAGSAAETVIAAKAETHESRQVTPTSVEEYSVGIRYRANFDSLYTPTWTDLELNVGRRLVGPVWGTGSYQPSTREFSLGVEVHF